MRLSLFQIKECFGFRDSGQIDIEDPTNLVYILGRNSSGKTSFLTALSYFAPGLIPKDYPNFTNFDSTSEIPSLLGKYTLGETDFTTNVFVKSFGTKMDQLNPDLVPITEFRKLKDELIKRLFPFYDDLAKSVINEGSLWVRRNASGEYQFSSEPSFKDSAARSKEQVPALLSSVPNELGLPMQSNGQRLTPCQVLCKG